jgi:hypothetical protein
MMTPENPTTSGASTSARPIIDAKIIQTHPSDEGAQHILRAMRKIHDIQQTKDYSEPKAEGRIEGTVDETKQDLGKQCLRMSAEEIEHDQIAKTTITDASPSVGSSSRRRSAPVRRTRAIASICCSPPESLVP